VATITASRMGIVLSTSDGGLGGGPDGPT